MLSAVLPLSLTTPTFPPLPVLCLCLCIGISHVRRQRRFMTASHTQKALVSGYIHCDINQMPQIRHIGYQSVVALSSPIVQITADIRCPISISVWHCELCIVQVRLGVTCECHSWWTCVPKSLLGWRTLSPRTTFTEILLLGTFLSAKTSPSKLPTLVLLVSSR